MKRNTLQVGILVLLLIAWELLGAAALSAKPMTETDVRKAAETWARTVTRDARPDAVVTSMRPYTEGGEVVAYAALLDGEGYCLCGADDLVLPVYLYMPHEKFDPTDPSVECIIWEVTERTRLYRAARGGAPDATVTLREDAVSDRATLWRELVDGQVPSRVMRNKQLAAEPTTITLPLTVRWHQGSPYNDDCPTIPPGSDTHVFVGCVATAASQIMYYWKYPTTGTGTDYVYYYYGYHTPGVWDETPLATDPELQDNPPWYWGDRLVWISTGGGKLMMTNYWDASILDVALDTNYVKNITPAYDAALHLLYSRLTTDSTYCYANFGATTYNWSVLQDVHSDPVDDGDPEAAKLCYHVGIACQMSYGYNASFSGGAKAEHAFEAHFRYDPDVIDTAPANTVTMTDEVAWLRPLMLGGCGHAWVVLGYDKSTDPDRLFLHNRGRGSLGWAVADEYCALEGMHHVVRIAPTTVKFVGNTAAGDGGPSSPYQNVEAAIAGAPAGSTLIFRAGSDNLFTANPLIIDKELTLKGANVTIRR
jgi:hypothetical protein